MKDIAQLVGETSALWLASTVMLLAFCFLLVAVHSFLNQDGGFVQHTVPMSSLERGKGFRFYLLQNRVFFT